MRTKEDHKRQSSNSFRLAMTRDEYAIRAANSVYQPERTGFNVQDGLLILLAVVFAAIFYAMC